MHFTGRLKPIKVHDKQACSAEVCRVLSIAAECCSREHAPSPRSPIDAASLSPWRGRDGFRSLVHSTASALAQAFYHSTRTARSSSEPCREASKKESCGSRKSRKSALSMFPKPCDPSGPGAGGGGWGRGKKKGKEKQVCVCVCVCLCV